MESSRKTGSGQTKIAEGSTDMTDNSEEAYMRFKSGESKAKIARDMNIRRGTITDWINKELEKRDEAYKLLKGVKNFGG